MSPENMPEPITAAELIDDFELFDDWEERFQYIVELGRELPDLPDEHRLDANLVQGCQSRVWLVGSVRDDGSETRVDFIADSDALIVKGLITIIVKLLSGKTPDEILSSNIRELFTQLDLKSHLMDSRSNGLNSMIDRVESLAKMASAEN
ncbi:MAG: SufE family protein [Pirellulaceae bacterium]|jgi:cysteine desulfuration protein SufE|nr:SufE family protein [Planctomycetaceae bacterium]HIM31971.1 SufE family protein [Planctomycetota bacterium]